MNGPDISRLSYKELQALASTYRVPGNIKKKLLIKVLQAAKGGDDGEVNKLLQELRQTRKRRARKPRSPALGITSTPLHSPGYAMNDDYCCAQQQQQQQHQQQQQIQQHQQQQQHHQQQQQQQQQIQQQQQQQQHQQHQQQPPYHWIGAEEEIASARDDDNRIPDYEEFKQFLLKKIQRDFQMYDANNNQLSDAQPVVDLRTVQSAQSTTTTPVACTISQEIGAFARSGAIAVKDTEGYAYQGNGQERVEYQILEDAVGANSRNLHGSILLKRMLQAPVGADLGEIASPMLGSYRVWSLEQYQPNNLLDTSDTLTAESESNGNEDNLTGGTECYNILNEVKGEYFLNEPSFVRNVEEIGQQIASGLTTDGANRFSYNDTETGQSWKPVDANETPGEFGSLKELGAAYYENVGTGFAARTTSDDNVKCRYEPYDANQNALGLNSPDDMQYYSTNAQGNAQSDTGSAYYLQNFIKNTCGAIDDYFQNVQSPMPANGAQEVFVSTGQQVFNNNGPYSADVAYQYDYNRNQEPGVVDLQNNNAILATEPAKDKAQKADKSASINTNGILEPFWPSRPAKRSPGANLENLLNVTLGSPVDYARIDQTSCVYCYTAPIVTQQPVSTSSACSQKKKFIAEQRQHSFSPNWLLYSDASSGLRMANVPPHLESSAEGCESQNVSPDLAGDSEIRESGDDSEDSICDVWIHDYANDVAAHKEMNICEEATVEETDPLLTAISTETDVSQ